MELWEAMQNRHSVRAYTERPIDPETLAELKAEIELCNNESGLHIQLATDEPAAFRSFLARYGSFQNVRNYFALVGKKGKNLDETVGYYGERLALKAQQLGLNTCWVALTFSRRKSKCRVERDEKLVCVIALGYGQTQGVAHKDKPLEDLCSETDEANRSADAGGTETVTPEWFARGMEAALLAPTALNHQKFFIERHGRNVRARSTNGAYAALDLGIVKFHFEQGAGLENFSWN